MPPSYAMMPSSNASNLSLFDCNGNVNNSTYQSTYTPSWCQYLSGKQGSDQYQVKMIEFKFQIP